MWKPDLVQDSRKNWLLVTLAVTLSLGGERNLPAGFKIWFLQRLELHINQTWT